MENLEAASVLDTPVGPLTVRASSTGLSGVGFGASTFADAEPPASAAANLGLALRQLEEYFAGDRRDFELPIDWTASRGWPLQVRRTLYETVGYGRQVSYGELAERSGRPGAAQAVGGIMAGNPIPVVVPCHRVVAADGGLGGFAGSGGTAVETKRRLLLLEGSAPPTLFDA